MLDFTGDSLTDVRDRPAEAGLRHRDDGQVPEPLHAGRLHPQKDPVLLVRSIAAMNNSNVHLLIAGDGDLRDEVRAEIDRLGLSQQVTMLGAIDRTELAQLQRVSSVFILTSAYEGLPLVVLEALACGTPVVTTRCGETPNLLTPNSGVVCEERTPVAVADALRKVLHNPGDFPISACVEAAEPYSAQDPPHVVAVVDGFGFAGEVLRNRRESSNELVARSSQADFVGQCRVWVEVVAEGRHLGLCFG